MNDKIQTPPREWWIELITDTDSDGKVFIEPVDGLAADAIHVIEKSAFDALMADARKLRDFMHDETADWHPAQDLVAEFDARWGK